MSWLPTAADPLGAAAHNVGGATWDKYLAPVLDPGGAMIQQGAAGGPLTWDSFLGGVPSSSFTATPATDQSGRPYDHLATASYLPQIGQTFAGENALAQSLTAQANGTGGPNLGEQLLRQATNQNIQSQAGAVASMRGLSPAAAQRLIALNGANIQQQAAGQAATERMQEQLAAQQQLAGLYGQTGQQAIGGNTSQNAAALSNQQGTQSLNQQTQAQNAALAGQARGQNAEGFNALMQPVASAIGGGAQGAGGALAGAALAAHGSVVPGRKDFPGDDTRNDKKPYLLSPGELVVPESIANDFIATAMYALKMKRGKRGAR